MTSKGESAITARLAAKTVCSVIGLDIHANKVMSVELDMSAGDIATFVVRIAATGNLLSAWTNAIQDANSQ